MARVRSDDAQKFSDKSLTLVDSKLVYVNIHFEFVLYKVSILKMTYHKSPQGIH